MNDCSEPRGASRNLPNPGCTSYFYKHTLMHIQVIDAFQNSGLWSVLLHTFHAGGAGACHLPPRAQRECPARLGSTLQGSLDSMLGSATVARGGCLLLRSCGLHGVCVCVCQASSNTTEHATLIATAAPRLPHPTSPAGLCTVQAPVNQVELIACAKHVKRAQALLLQHRCDR
jgi:hypothetical protein